MFPDESYRRHIRFRKIDLQATRHKRSFPVPKPERDHVQHGETVKRAVIDVKKEFEQFTESSPPEFDPDLIFRIKLDDPYIDEAEFKRSNLTLLSQESKDIVVLFSEDQLAEFETRVDQYQDEIPDGQQSPRYSWIAGVTEEIQLWGRDDRIGKKLSKIDFMESKEFNLDVELWHYGSDEECELRISQLENFLLSNEGEILDRYTGESIILLRILASRETLENLLNTGIVKKIDLPPEPKLNVGVDLTHRLDDFDTPAESPPNESAKVCIIDSGINTGHPLISQAIGDSECFPRNLGGVLDESGHGTMVAGVVLYGDVTHHIESLGFQPDFYIFNCRVTNENGEFDDRSLIINQMEESIRYFHYEYGCRIFNISLGDPELIFDDDKPSGWSFILDYLARELDILIVTSAGNTAITSVSGENAEEIRNTYPNYLFDDENRIIEPGIAALVLTVGAIAKNDNPINVNRHPNDPAISCIAGKNQPSPFTRGGPGLKGAIKPDVCDYGGNVTWDGRSNLILVNDRNVSVVSMNNSHTERLFKYDVGTSFSAAKVSNIAGKILSTYPNISANLLRAFIAHSSSVPGETRELFPENIDRIMEICGYGQPNLEKALYSTETRVTLFAEDSIPLDNLHLYGKPIPEEYQRAGGRRRISITLAFDPPTRNTRIDYLGLEMDFYLFRGLSTERILEWYAERGDDANPENIESKFKCNIKPSKSRIDKGTLQKASFVATRNGPFINYDGNSFHLLIRSKARWIDGEKYPIQKYAVVISIEHLEEEMELYNIIEQRIQQAVRVRVRG